MIKVRCKKDYMDYIPEDILIDNGLEMNYNIVFKKGEIYDCTDEMKTTNGSIIHLVYSNIKNDHGDDPYYTKFLFDKFYTKYSDEVITKRENRIKRFHEYKSKLDIFKDIEFDEFVPPLENKFDEYFEIIN